MQVFPNFTSSTVRGGNAAPIQAVAQTYLFTSNDVSNGYASVPVTFDTPFADSNYIVVFTVEYNGLAGPAGNIFSDDDGGAASDGVGEAKRERRPRGRPRPIRPPSDPS